MTARCSGARLRMVWFMVGTALIHVGSKRASSSKKRGASKAGVTARLPPEKSG